MPGRVDWRTFRIRSSFSTTAVRKLPKSARSFNMKRILITLALSTAALTVAIEAQERPTAVVNGIRLEVRPEVAHPRPLSRPLVALFVVIENGGKNDLDLRSVPFTIVTEGGRTYRAIAPDALRRSPESSPFVEPAIALSALPLDPLNPGARTLGFIYFAEIEESPPWTLKFSPSSSGEAESISVIVRTR